MLLVIGAAQVQTIKMSNNSTIDLVEEFEGHFNGDIFGAYDNNNCSVEDETEGPRSIDTAPEEIIMDPRGPQVAEAVDEAEISLRRNNFLLRQKWRIVKNMAFLNFALLLDLSAVLSIIEFKFKQTPEFALIRLFVFYGSAAIGCLVVVQPMTKLITHKWVVTASFIGHTLVIAARFFPTKKIILAASGLGGLALTMSLAAAFAYVSRAAQVYTALTSQNLDAVVGKLMGFVWTTCFSANVWGSLISGFILQTLEEPMFVSDALSRCGSTVCFNTSTLDVIEYNLNDVTSEFNSIKESTLIGTSLGLVVLACITTAVCVGRLPPVAVLSNGEQKDKANQVELRSFCLSVLRTVQLWSDCRMLFLIPLIVHLGLQISFFNTALMQHFAACSIGTWSRCFLIITFGGISSLVCLLVGGLSRCVRRRTLMTIATLVQLGIFAWLFIWQLHDFHFYVFLAILFLWAATASIWAVCVSRFLGATFSSNESEESSFANLFLWITAGSFVGDYFKKSLCIYNQLYIMMGTLCLGIGGYYGAEVALYKRRVNEVDINYA